MRRIPVAEPDISALERNYVKEAMDSGWIASKGSYIPLFEEEFCRYTGSAHAITTMNGTVSLHLILAALGLGPGDEVIVPTFTYIASVNAIKYVGSEPVFVDCRKDTWNMDHEKIEELITPRTKAIMGVHLFGHSMDLDPIKKICDENDLYLIEDAAEALGTLYRNKHVGNIGIAGSFSFFGNKTVTTGEGGMVITSDDDLAERMGALKDQGNSKTTRYWHDVVGFNYRMTNLQAAIGYGQMQRVEHLVSRRRKNAEIYSSLLPDSNLVKPYEAEYCRHSFWMYSVLLQGPMRDAVMSRMEEEYSIETRPFFYPAHTMPMYVTYAGSKFPVAEEISGKGMSLPSSSTLTDEELRYVSTSLSEVLEGLS